MTPHTRWTPPENRRHLITFRCWSRAPGEHLTAGLYKDGLLVACSITGEGQRVETELGHRYELIYFTGIPPIHGVYVDDTLVFDDDLPEL